ncbi:TPA: recombinase [Citrobacter freundii]|uniref:Ref family recombination enhancement nuclease n=1 Tax=Citrobacter freundii TaxID=546 RepID=UPI0015F78820|nr:Ref family recombination enhancement nuclease [Citrobacter freundii]MBA7974809.1 recombinase [Citrobacter freundii]MDN4265552.1 Ref family recombination enhancement nuclease [Citrobacter freundii]MDN4275431.1 Ref family recombination enhancement nuclease [Citrobacter freundii]HBN5192012.1 recombinase [Citrobacter freundii]HBU6547748.1 recombinase [Citrobacter freundii]
MKTIEEKLQRNFERQRTYQQRAIERQREKQANPEWRQAQYEKHRERQSRYIERAKNKPCNRGLKGRTPRAAERSLMDKIGALPCIACYVHGVINEVVSLHHINGRTITGAHAFVLPLCNHHHQNAAPTVVRAIYSWLVPVHADGNCGGKSAFEALNGSQEHLYSLCLEMIA